MPYDIRKGHPKPIDEELYQKATEIVDKQYKKPSAYRSGAIQKKYKELGGRYEGSKQKGELKRWFDEEWEDIGGLEYPVYRPTKRINKDTPLTASEIDPIQAKEQIKLKQKIKGKKNLPPFEAKEGGRIDLKEIAKKVGRVAKVIVPAVVNPAVGVPLALSKLKKRTEGKLPPQVRKFLEQHGDEKITSIEVIRTPVESFLQKALSLVSLGTWKDAVRSAGYDDIFHLALILNNQYMLDKQEVIKIGNPKRTPKTQSLSIPVSKDITFNQLLENARLKMGDANFSNYDPKNNNCQDFVMALLDASGLNTDASRQFIKQDAVRIFENTPSFTSKIAKTITDIGAVANELIEGEGAGKYLMYENGKCWTIINHTTGRVVDYCLGSKEMAQAKVDALNKLSEETTKEEKNDEKKLDDEIKKDIKAIDKIKKEKIKSFNNKQKKSNMETWREYYGKQVKGKKFSSRAEVNAFMKQCAESYKKLKEESTKEKEK